MMSHTANEDAQLLSLPVELLENILVRVQSDELKALRQTSKFLQKLTTPRLYARFTLYPHIRSFERLLSIAESEDLRRYVRHLTYDTGYLGLTDRFIRRLQSVWSSEISADEKKKAIEHAHVINSQKIRAEVAMDNMVQLNYLERAFTALVNLRHIVVEDSSEHLNEGFTREELPSFYAQLAEETCGRYPHTRLERGTLGVRHLARATYTHAVLIAASKLSQPLQHLELNGLSWQNFLQQGTFSKFRSLFQRNMAGLKSLNLYAEGIGYFPDTRAMANLQTLLRAAENLEELTLSDRWCDDIRLYGPDLVDDDIGTTCNSMFQSRPGEQNPLSVPAQLIWSPKLRYLDLYGITISAKEFKNVLKPCCETLEFISLANIMLMPEDFSVIRGIEIPRACWVNMLKWMQRHLKNLKSLNINARLTNGGMQHWHVNPFMRDENSLRMRVYSFLLKGGPCPLEHVAIKPGDFDLKKKTWKGAVPELLETPEYAGDESWMMEYNDESDIESALNDDDDIMDDWEVETDLDEEDWNEEDEDDDDIFPHGFPGMFPPGMGLLQGTLPGAPPPPALM
ncbi:hypothetical protein OHC33_007518 [Knufia fluminis]|uniref:F-box domain-containing protein n=1 Tax=Knufia fluminis TaxID=191047 RepID=A0AAN8EIA4_9EURO|nr:hypothetical protein OHC33_007518 [Knufia fluminis]